MDNPFTHSRVVTGESFCIESKIEKLLKLATDLKLSVVVEPMTGQPTVSVSISRSERPKYLKTDPSILLHPCV